MNLKKTVSFVLRFGISIGLLVFLASRINYYDTTDASGQIERGLFSIVSNVDLIWFIPGFVILFGQIWLFTLRWKILLNDQGINLSYSQVFRLTYIGVFFNSFLLGSAAGDIVKSGFIFKDTEFKTKAAISIIIDRLVGFTCLTILCLVGLLIIDIPNVHFRVIKHAGLIASFSFLLTLAFLVVFSRSKFMARIGFLNRGLPGRMKEAFIVYHDNFYDILKTIGISLVIHLIIILNNILFAKALGITGVPIWYFLVLVPLADLMAFLPISIGGWGVGETSYVYLLGIWNVALAPSIALSVLFRLSNTLWSMPGALFIIIKPKNQSQDQTTPK